MQQAMDFKAQLLRNYVNEKMELTRLELILDNLFMAKLKDSDWEEKYKKAQELYNETKELVDFLTHVFHKEFNQKTDIHE